MYSFKSITGLDAVRQYSCLLDGSFPVSENTHFFDDFPIWNPSYQNESVFRLGIFHEDQLVSTASVRLSNLKFRLPGHADPQKEVSVAIIGAVATHPQWKGRGLASRAVTWVEQWAKERGSLLALLWGSEYQLYSRLGFELFGSQLQIPLVDLELPHVGGLNIYEGWNPSIFSLIQNRSEGLKLNSSDLRWFEAHKNVKWLWTGDQEHPSAYVGLGRGIDLQNLIHEWGGEVDQLRRIFAYLRDLDSRIGLLAKPDHLKEFGLNVISNRNESWRLESLGMAKILNPESLLKQDFALAEVSLWVWGLDAS